MRRVVVHNKKRGKRLSRYTHFNTVLKQARVFNKIKDNVERNRQVDSYMKDLLRYSDARCIHVLRLLMINGKVCVVPFRIPAFDEFHKRCGRYVVDSTHAHSHVDDIVNFGEKIDHILRRKKPPYRQRVACYHHEGAENFTVSAETYLAITKGVREALSRLEFDPVRDFSENTIGLVDAMWKINQLTKKDE